MDDKPFIVFKSSAGSGKTFALSKIYLSLILSNPDVYYYKHILALTFTVKAAAEMKDRIINYLSAISGNKPSTRADIPFMIEELKVETGLSEKELAVNAKVCLQAILHGYSDLSILTIDKFIARLVRSFSNDLALTPDFEIEIDHKLFVEEVIEQLFEEIGSSDELTRIVLAFLEFRLTNEDSVRVEDPIKTLAEATLTESFFFLEERIQEQLPKDIFKLKKKLLDESSRIEQKTTALGQEALQLIELNGLTAQDISQGKNGIYGLFEKVSRKDFQCIVEPKAKMIQSAESDTLQSSTKHPTVLSINDVLRNKFYNLLDQKEEIKRYYLLQAVINEVYTLGLVNEILRLGNVVKDENNFHLLSDFNRIIASQFEGEQAPFLYERLGNKYAHILIDEFQDTSSLQSNNLLPLVENTLAEGKISLVVGDAKQAIYRFRGSDARLFTNIPNIDHPAAELLAGSYEEVKLNTNYRSAKNVVDFNNKFFTSVSKNFLQPEHTTNYADLEQRCNSQKEGVVKWWFGEPNATGKNEDLLQQMISRIAQCINEGELKQGEVCCLFRNNADASKAAAELLQLGFNVISEESLLLEKNPGVGLIISTLEVLKSQNDPYKLQLWLSKYHRVYHIEAYHQIAAKIKKDKLEFNNVLDLLQLDIHLTGTVNTFTKCFQLAESFEMDLNDAFLLKLLDFCSEFESNGHYLKESFIGFWERKKEKLSIALPDGNDAIRVMTIHKSKGLEFPSVFVYLPKFKSSSLTQKSAWINPDLGLDLGLTYVQIKDLKHTNHEEMLTEEQSHTDLDFLNTVYVAFTRAENRLEVFSHEASLKDLAFLSKWEGWQSDNKHFEICGN